MPDRIIPHPRLADFCVLSALMLAIWTPGSAQQSDPRIINLYETSSDAPRMPIFFPPVPPALGAALPPCAYLDQRILAPAELAPVVGEFFYPALSSLFADRKLGTKLSVDLKSFLALRDALGAELIKDASASSDQDGAEIDRRHQGRAAALKRLANDAERLRRACIAAGTTWGGLVLTAPPEPTNLAPAVRLKMEHDAIRAAAFYENELLPMQRELLIEIAIEIDAGSVGASAPTLLRQDQRLVFFHPATARISLPNRLPDPLEEKFVEFVRLKTELKRELRSTVDHVESDRVMFRSRAWRQIAAKQAARLTLLDDQAETLRREFRTLGISVRPATAPLLPVTLGANLAKHLVARRDLDANLGDDLQRTVSPLLAHRPGSAEPSFRSFSSPAPVSSMFGRLTYSDATVWFNLLDLPAQKEPIADPSIVREQVNAVVTAFRKRMASGLEALATERKSLELEVAAVMAPDTNQSASKALDVLLALCDQANAWPSYELYRRSVLEPSLSTDERRLLFGMAIRRLNLHLPGGELQPKR
jgi:hypothetical protein